MMINLCTDLLCLISGVCNQMTIIFSVLIQVWFSATNVLKSDTQTAYTSLTSCVLCNHLVVLPSQHLNGSVCHVDFSQVWNEEAEPQAVPWRRSTESPAAWNQSGRMCSWASDLVWEMCRPAKCSQGGFNSACCCLNLKKPKTLHSALCLRCPITQLMLYWLLFKKDTVSFSPDNWSELVEFPCLTFH